VQWLQKIQRGRVSEDGVSWTCGLGSDETKVKKRMVNALKFD